MTVTAETCSYPWEWAMVASNGDVRPCCYGGVVGSLHEASFEAIWNNRNMLEVRHAVSTGQLHSVCRGAACSYSIAKAAQRAEPTHEEVRYAFGQGKIIPGAQQIRVEGVIANVGAKAWATRDAAGRQGLRVGARLLDAEGSELASAFAPIAPEFFFPGEVAPFSLTLPMEPWQHFVLDLECQALFWFGDRGGQAVRVSQPAPPQTQSGSGS